MLEQSSNDIEAERRAAKKALDNAEWRQVDRRLREYARHRSALDAAESFDLVRAEQLKLYSFFGFVNLYEYMERVLGYGPHTARERMRVARALSTLPETAAALAGGHLTYSGVRELTRVATAETESAWLAAATGLAANQIESLVANHRLGDRPEDPTVPDLRPRVVRIELPPEVYALWRQARMVVAGDRGTEISDADFIETICRSVIAPGSGEQGPAHQIAYQQCPDCRRATQNGAGREIDVGPEVLERASCDAKVLGLVDPTNPERGYASVTPRMREQVFARDHHRCTVPGCRSARNLDVHHIEYQSHGGGHEKSNLTILCSGHHAALHNGLLAVEGRAPYELKYRWTYGPPIPIGIGPDARRALIEEQVQEIFQRLTEYRSGDVQSVVGDARSPSRDVE
jgi:hypothetical protein